MGATCDALARLREWPDGLTRYIASLHEMDVDTWQRVTDFVDRTRSARLQPDLSELQSSLTYERSDHSPAATFA